ncbi:MAG: tRNA (guanosine(46)-N7)-methyltransferase TrmB [Bacteroidota bacterium]
MAKVSKKVKFQQNMESHNVLEPDKEGFEGIKGNWHRFFSNRNPLVAELACGWGEYTLGLAELYPEKNHIGIDLKGDRIWRGSQHALNQKLGNVAFLRIHIIELLNLFDVGELDEIWLTFPDPRPKDRDEKHRLTNPSYLAKYREVLTSDGWFKFKTDNSALFQYTLEVLEKTEITNLAYTWDLYGSELLEDHFGIQTKYEKIWTAKGANIKYLKFQFAPD